MIDFAESPIRSIFASDLHMGHCWSNFRELHSFLKSIESPEHLYLLGDIIDGWSFPRGWHWTQDHNNFVRKVFSLAKHDCQVHYVVGHHDEFLLQYVGHDFGQFTLIREMIHTTADGRRFLILHGDQFDRIAKAAPILYLLGNRAYPALLRANVVVSRIRRIFRRPQWSLSLWAKTRTKKINNFLTDFENVIMRYAAEKRCDGVIAGHTHAPAAKEVNGILYYNCGDFQEQAAAVIERLDGHLELVDIKALNVRPVESAAPASRRAKPAPV